MGEHFPENSKEWRWEASAWSVFLRHSLLHDLSSSDLDEDQIRDEENVADDNNTSDGCYTKLFDFCDTHPMATVNVNCVALNAIWASFAWICQAGWKVWKSAEKCNYFLLSYLCAQIAHSTVHRCCTFSFFGGQPPLLPAVMALIGWASLGNLKQLKGR